jgi:putative molybdopterin biosynthesis protein
MASSGTGAELRAARQARGFSQGQLASIAGVTRQGISALESGRSDPSLRVALALARALGLSVEELFGPGEPAAPLTAVSIAPLTVQGERVSLGQVGDLFIALPLRGDAGANLGFLPAGGLTLGQESRPELKPAVTGLDTIARQGLRIVNREPGAEARRLLETECRRLRLAPGDLPGYDTQAAGHLQVASAISAGLASAGITSEPAARAYRLAFIPLTEEQSTLVIPAAHGPSPEVQALLKVLSSPWLLAQLASLPGYDTAHCGDRQA